MRKILFIALAFCLLASPIQANVWPNKPPIGSTINWSHPLAKGLVGAWLMNERGGLKVLELVSAKFGTLTSGAKFITTSKGIATGYTQASSQYLEAGSLPLIDKISSDITIVIYYSATSSATNAAILSKRTGNDSHFSIDYGGSANSSNFGFTWENGGTFCFVQVLSGAPQDGNFYQYTVTRKGLVAPKLYRDTKILTIDNSSSATTAFQPNTATINFSRLNYATPAYCATKIVYCYIYNRAITLQEIQQLYADPYCFINPPTVWSKFKTSVVAAARRMFIF
jgi:hypothetical protein